MFQKIQKILIISGFVSCLILPLKLSAFEVLPEFKAAYFYPSDHRFRNVYSDAGFYSFETNVQSWRNIYSWASLGFLYTSGTSIGESKKTELYMIPIGLGLKYLFRHNQCVQPYLGLGLVVAYIHVYNDSKFVMRNQTKWGVGGIAKAGFLTYISRSLFFDFFLDYTYLKRTFDTPRNKLVINHKVDLSGLSIGGGIGYCF